MGTIRILGELSLCRSFSKRLLVSTVRDSDTAVTFNSESQANYHPLQPPRLHNRQSSPWTLTGSCWDTPSSGGSHETFTDTWHLKVIRFTKDNKRLANTNAAQILKCHYTTALLTRRLRRAPRQEDGRTKEAERNGSQA